MTNAPNEATIMSLGIYKQIGKNIRARRKELGLTQEELGEAINKHQHVISRTEHGHTGITIYTLCVYALALRTSVNDLVLKDPEVKS